jgi:hypothetical protein
VLVGERTDLGVVRGLGLVVRACLLTFHVNKLDDLLLHNKQIY